MSKVRRKIQELNQQIRWKPKHLKDGRFGNFLDELKDWSLSRSRYWGTPLPIWTCENGDEFIIGSREELETLTDGGLPEGFSLHKPDVDLITVRCPTCNAKATREEYVIDCWYDSGSATFAQWHYPFENKELFDEHFPINFITEAIDQTRGWFYSLLAISTSRGNVYAPEDLFTKYGADPARWLLFSSPTWNDVRFGYSLVEESMKEFIIPLWNVLSFFVTYANLDKYSPNNDEYHISPSDRPLLDRWILSRYNNTLNDIHLAFDDLAVHRTTKALQLFLANDLSNLWIRQSRRRFWEKDLTISKKSAYSTLYEILQSLSKALGPLLPFLAEAIHQMLVKSQGLGLESVHLEQYPEANEDLIDSDLEVQVAIGRDAISNGRAIRARKDLKVRWPLTQVIFVTNDTGKQALTAFKDLILQELNVKDMTFTDDPLDFQEIIFSPNFKQLGPKFKKKANDIANWMRSQTGHKAMEIANELTDKGNFTVKIKEDQIVIDKDDLEIRITEREGFSGSPFIEGNLFLNLELNNELIQEGFVRDLIRRIQSMRKDMALVYDAEIKVNFSQSDPEAIETIKDYSSFIQEEVLATSLNFSKTEEGFTKDWKIQDPHGNVREITISIQK
jgi:isoleucyl-tRNA synthetase